MAPLVSLKPRAFNHRGSALVLVVGVGTVILILVFGWVAFSVHQAVRGLRWEEELQARYAAESVVSKSIYALMAAQTGAPFIDTVKISPDSIQTQTISYVDTARACSASATIEPRGPYIHVLAEARSRRSRCRIEAVFGKELSSDFKSALILASPKPLRIDKGIIRGDVRAPVPPSGPFEGRHLPGAGAPYLDPKPFVEIMERLDQRLGAPLSTDKIIAGSTPFSRSRPLPLETDGAVFVDGQVLLDNSAGSSEMVIKGPGTLVATGDIQISGNVRIEDLDILSGGNVKCFDKVRIRNTTIGSRATIYFDDQAKFWGRLYARESVVLVNQAEALSPTLAFVQGQASSGRSGPISAAFFLGQDARFTGTLICNNSQVACRLSKGSLFTGVFFTLGPLALEGIVHGTVAASILRSEYAPNENILWNGTILRNLLPHNFVMPVALGPAGGEYKLMRWSESH